MARANAAHARDAGRPASRRRRRISRLHFLGVERAGHGQPSSSALRIESASSLRPPRIVAVPSARSSAALAIGHRRVGRCARVRTRSPPRTTRVRRQSSRGARRREPRGDRVRRGGLWRGMQHGYHAQIIRGSDTAENAVGGARATTRQRCLERRAGAPWRSPRPTTARARSASSASRASTITRSTGSGARGRSSTRPASPSAATAARSAASHRHRSPASPSRGAPER